MPGLDPRNYSTPADFLNQFQKDPTYMQQTPDMQRTLRDVATKKWQEANIGRVERVNALKDIYDREYKGTGGSWLEQVQKTSHRATESALGGIFGGPGLAQRAWEDPGAHPWLRAGSGLVPFFGADTPEQLATQLWVAGMAYLTGGASLIPGMELEGASGVAGMIGRGAGQVAGSAAVGAAINTPRAISTGDYTKIGTGAVQGGILGATGLFGNALALGSEGKMYADGVGQSLGGLVPKIGKSLTSAAAIAKTFMKSVTDASGTAMSQGEKAAGEALADSGGKVMDEVGDELFRYPFTPQETNALQKAKIPVPGIARSPAPVFGPGAGARASTIPGRTAGGAGASVQTMTVREAVQLLDDMDKEGWDPSGRLAEGEKGIGRMVRSTGRKMFDTLYQHVDDLLGGSTRKANAGQWYMDYYANKTTKMLANMFQTKGMIVGDKIIPSVLQKAVTGEYLSDILENGAMFSPDPANPAANPGVQLIRSAMRGAPAWAKKDVEGALRSFWSIHPIGMIGKALGSRMGAVGAGLRMGGAPTFPYKAGQIALESGMTKMMWNIAAKYGVTGIAQAFQEMMNPDQGELAGELMGGAR